MSIAKKTAASTALASLVALGSARGQAPQATSEGLVVPIKEGTVRLQVFSPRAVRVVYGAESPQSYVVLAKPLATGWTWKTTSGEVRLRTSALEARVAPGSGRVSFFDIKGRPLLAETGRSLANGGARQGFALAPGEAIYGLGQHQAGALDQRGTTVHLQQENREIAVPFLTSSRGYAILWDNASITDVNVGAGESGPIPDGTLRAEDGTPGLTGRYFRGRNFETPAFARTDAKVDFDWTATPPTGLPHDGYSVRWTGTLDVPKAGVYGFTARADDGARLWIDENPVFDDWAAAAARDISGRVALTKGRHAVRLEYYQNAFDASIRFSWTPPATGPEEVTWRSEAAKAVDYTFILGPKVDDAIAEYRRLTGPAPMFARWAWGLWQSKERYASQAELLEVVKGYRSRGFPLDGVVQDWQYWSPAPWGSHAFDPARYPDPAGMIRDLHALDAHLLISVWAKFDEGIPNARELAAAGGLYPQAISYVFPPGKGQWYDPFSEGGRRVYWSQLARSLFPYVDGWWLDASEPELSGRWGEFRDYATGMGPGRKVFNAYPLFHTKAVYEGQRAQTDAKRAIILTRSAYLGQQRNGAVSWSGDINGDWTTFRAQIPAGINLSLSGLPYWNTDIGGFFGAGRITPEYAELFTRWYQFGAFCPMFRVHGTNAAKEPWRFPEATQRDLLEADRLRYHLLPYVYSVSSEVTRKGASMMRGLVFDFPNDPLALQVKDQFLFGPSIMACPVTAPGASSRPVYLPRGEAWVDFWTGERLAGGRTVTAAAPVSRMPLFVRAGSVLPYGPQVETAAASDDPLEIRVYPGANGTFDLYDDVGDGYGYERGESATIPLRWDEKARTLEIGARQGAFPGMRTARTFRVVLVGPERGTGVPSSTGVGRSVEYRGEIVRVRL